MSISRYTIYGERCSGTNYLANLMDLNFHISPTREYGHKHFFGFNNEKLKDSDDTLFICIVRDPHKWMNSLFNDRFHLPFTVDHFISRERDIDNFLNKEFYSVQNPYVGVEIMEDRNMLTKERYRNIFELRDVKLRYMIEELPKMVKHYIFIKYEDLVDKFEETMNRLKDMGLPVKDNDKFPVNTKMYKKFPFMVHIPNKRRNYISKKMISENPNLARHYEEKLGYMTNYRNDKDYDTPIHDIHDWIRSLLFLYLIPGLSLLFYLIYGIYH